MTFPPTPEYDVHPSILYALDKYQDDPVAAMLSLKPELADQLAEPRLLEVAGEEPVWMTEGDKMRLRREGKFFIDVTERQDVAGRRTGFAGFAGKASKSTQDAKYDILVCANQQTPLISRINTGSSPVSRTSRPRRCTTS